MSKTVDKLKDGVIRAAQAKDKRYKLSDGGGLYLVVSPSGSKWWRFDYRFGGKQHSISFGIYGVGEGQISITKARREAGAARAAPRQGRRRLGSAQDHQARQ